MLDRPAVAGRAAGSRSRGPGEVCQQPQADGAGPARPSRHAQGLSPRRVCVTVRSRDDAANPTKRSWSASVLPWLEQDALYRSIHADLPYTDPANLAAGQTVLAVFLCPTSPRDSLLRPSPDAPINRIRPQRLWGRQRRARPAFAAGEQLAGARRPDPANGTCRSPTSPTGRRRRSSSAKRRRASTRSWISVHNVFDQSAPVSERHSDTSPYPSCTVARRLLRLTGRRSPATTPAGRRPSSPTGRCISCGRRWTMPSSPRSVSRAGGEPVGGDF